MTPACSVIFLLADRKGSESQLEQPFGVAALSLFLTVFPVDTTAHDRLLISPGVPFTARQSRPIRGA